MGSDIFSPNLACRLPHSQPCEDKTYLSPKALNGVEDEFTEIPFNPGNETSDGRMYPPQKDSARDVPENPRVARYRSRKHNTYRSSSGAIRIEDLKSQCLIDKRGVNGKKIALWK